MLLAGFQFVEGVATLLCQYQRYDPESKIEIWHGFFERVVPYEYSNMTRVSYILCGNVPWLLLHDEVCSSFVEKS